MKKSRLYLVIISMSLFFFDTSLFAQDFEWVKQIGGSSNDYSAKIAVDALGNVYTTGYFQGTVDFDPSPASYPLTSEGLYDVFISKTDASGNFVWAKQLGGTDFDNGYSIAIDGIGNVYATGVFRLTADFDPGAGTFNMTSQGNDDVYVLKLDASGNFIWARQIGGNGLDIGASIITDVSGNIYVSGLFEGTVDFDPGAGTQNLVSAGGRDAFVLKLDASGDFVWAKHIGGIGTDYARSLDIDGSGNVYAAGYFENIVDFDPGAGIHNLESFGGRDAFILKLDASGNFVWAKTYGGLAGDEVMALAVDDSGISYITGFFNGTVDFDPGNGTYDLTSAGGEDIYILKLDALGNFIWAKQIGDTGNESGRSIAIDGSGNSYISGYFRETADFNPGVGSHNLTSAGGSDIFILKLDALGNFIWAKQIGGAGDDGGQSITIDASGNIFTTGYFNGTVDFDTGISTFNLSSVGEMDIFIHKLSQNAVGINENLVRLFNIYPNPAKDVITISELPIGAELSILDINGKIMFSTSVNSNQLTINTEDFTNGLYLIHLNHSGATSTKKLIVNK